MEASVASISRSGRGLSINKQTCTACHNRPAIATLCDIGNDNARNVDDEITKRRGKPKLVPRKVASDDYVAVGITIGDERVVCP
jgi:hypothetical protein